MKTEYKPGTVGHVLHYLREWGIPETIAGTVMVGTAIGGEHDGKNCVYYGSKLFAQYQYFEGIEQPLFCWYQHADSYNAQIIELQRDGSLKPKFRLTLDETTYMGGKRYPVLLFQGHEATPELREFLLRTMDAQTGTARDVCRAASTFWRLSEKGKGFYVEINDSKGAQAFVDYVNENYVPPAPSL